jgi:hypothetical protein
MDEQNMFGGVQSASPWVVNVPNAKLVAMQMKQATLNQLLGEAQKLAPDATALSDALLKYDIPEGDKAKFSAGLNNMLNTYLNNYNTNPFYAFSREGKQLTKDMQQWVRHPMLPGLADMNSRLKKMEEQVTEKGLGAQVNVKNRLVNVYDTVDNKFVWKKPEAIDYDRDKIYNANDIISSRKSIGFFNPKNPYKLDDIPEIQMSSYADLISSLNNILSGTGSVTVEQFGSDIQGLEKEVIQTTKTNIPNLDQKARAIFSNAGLPDTYWDTLLSNVYTKYRDRGYKLPSDFAATQEAISTLNDIIYSRQITDPQTKGIPGGGSGSGEAGAKGLENVGKYEMFARGVGMGGEAQATLDDKGTQRTGLSNPLFWNFTENNREVGLLPLSMNPVFNSFAQPIDALTTLDGRQLDKSLVIPVAPDGAKIVKGETPDFAYLVFDAFIREDAAQDIEDAFQVRTLLRSEEDYIAGLENTLKELSEKDPRYIFSQSSMWTYGDSDYYRAPVKIKIDPSWASEAARTYLDTNQFKSSTTGYNLTQGVKEDIKKDTRPVYTPK